jgi:hypothetical protein
MIPAACASPSLPSLASTAVPLRSPRTSIILAELARQRRLERCKRRLQRQRRRQAWARVTAWFRAFGHWPSAAREAQGQAAGLSFAEALPLIYAPPPCW